MSTVLIVLFLVVGLVIVASLALGRMAYEVDSARDTEYLELDGNWIRYDVIGGGPPVLLVHGWLSSSRVWDRLAGRLAQRFTVYTLDLTGFGESDKPLSGYGVRNGSRLLYAFCAHFGLTRVSVIGHDLGGNMVVKLAADHPDVVGRLALICTPASEDQIDLPTPLWLATLPVIGPLFYALGRLLRPVRSMWMRPFVLEPDDLTEEAVDDAAMSTPAAVSKTLGVTRREIGGGRLARQARVIKVPILLVAGEEDQIVDPQAVAAWSRSADQAEVVLMEECGHMPMIERTAEFNAQILAFLTGDARYLDYVEEIPEDDEKEEEGEILPDDEHGVANEGPGGEDPAFPASGRFREEPEERPVVNGESPEPRSEDVDEELDRPPTIHRRRGGRYSVDGSSDEPSAGNGTGGLAEPREPLKDPPRDIFEGKRHGGGGAGKGEIPEVPEDLFSWPDSRRDSRSSESESSREHPSEKRSGREDLDDPENPSPL